MDSLKILTVVGARPQFIKAEPFIRAVLANSHHHILVHTGQHWDHSMSSLFFEELGIPAPDVNLDVRSASHGVQTGEMLAKLEGVIMSARPDYVIVFGDTNSTLAGALAAAKLHIRVAHIEAGLRSWNRQMPEEINRIVTDHLADILFAPTQNAAANLRREGILPSQIHWSGDIMQDAFHRFAEAADSRSSILERLHIARGQYILATIHRAENTDDDSRIADIFEGFDLVSEVTPVVCPLHPRTRAALERVHFAPRNGRLILVEPIGYLDMIALEKHASLIATDSGGVQKEAFFSRVPCVTLRSETEWTELVEAGWNRLCPGTSALEIRDGILQFIGATGREIDPYGSGKAAQRIVLELERAA